MTESLEFHERPRERVRPWLERFSRRFFPGTVANREYGRFRLRQAELAHRMFDDVERQLLSRGSHDGASKEHGQSQWSPGGGSADEDLLDDLPLLRERSRDLIRNDPDACGLIDEWVEGVIGNGLVPQPTLDRDALGITEEEARRYSRAVHKIFVERWWPRCDIAGLLSFGEVQELVLRQYFENGEGFAIQRPQASRQPYAQALQLIESDQVLTPTEKLAEPDKYRDGIEMGPLGEHVAYWVKKTHPGDSASGWKIDDFVRIDAADEKGRTIVHHLYRHRRPGQSRGSPKLASAIRIFRDLKQYSEAELVAAKVAACFALFVTTDDPHGMAAAAAAQSGLKGKKEEFIKPGAIRYLGLGEKVTTGNPGRPNPNYDAYTVRNQRRAFSSVRMPYEVGGCDFSETTYTSGRMSLLQVHRVYRRYRKWFADGFCQHNYRRVLEEAFFRGELRVPRFLENFDEWTRCRWKGNATFYVDPEKEVGATIDAINANLTTLADECAERNSHWEDVLEQRAAEVKKIRELGLEEPSLARPTPRAGGVSDGQGGARRGQSQREPAGAE